MEPGIGRSLCKLFPDDENVNLGSKSRASRDKEHKRLDQGSPRLEFASFWLISRNFCLFTVKESHVYLQGHQVLGLCLWLGKMASIHRSIHVSAYLLF